MRAKFPPRIFVTVSFLACAVFLVHGAGCATGPSTLSLADDPMVSPAQLVSNPRVTVHDERGAPSIFYASDIVREDDASGIFWRWQSAKERKSGAHIHGVFWTQSYVAREPRRYQSVTLVDGSPATLMPDEMYDGKHITSKCDGSSCRISESYVVFFDEEDVRAARTGGLAFKMHAGGGVETATTIPGPLIDAVLRVMDRP